jgi:phosphate-selective porin OprO and OprP
MNTKRELRTAVRMVALAVPLAYASAQQAELSQQEIEARLERNERELAELRALVGQRAPRPSAGYDGGFYIESPDREWRFTLEALLQVRATAFERGLEGRNSGFDLERMRFELGGEYQHLYRFHVEPNFGADDVELEEAWIGFDLAGGRAGLLLGRMKEPFGLEEMLPRRHFDFPTFSALNQFSPAEDHGITLLGGSLEGPLEYGVAVYNGTGGDESNSDKDVAARLVTRPWAESAGSALRGFQLGAAATWGRADEDVSGAELRTEAKAPFLEFEPDSAIDGDRLRLGLETAWLRGPFALTAEAMRVEQDMSGAGGDIETAFEGWYASASWVVSGETKTFRGVVPAHPLVGGEAGTRGSGAFQLAARYSQLMLDDDLVMGGLVDPSAFTDRVDTWDVGLNWYSTAHTKVMLHFIRTEFADDIVIDGEERGAENALLVQFQLQF